MKKTIWKNYLNIWRFRQICAAWKNHPNFNSIWMPVYLLTVIPALWINNLGKTGLVMYYCYLIPILLTYYTARRMPMGLPKLIYLVPMSAEDRKNYVTGMYRIKIAVPLALSLAAMLAARFLSLIDWYQLFFGILMQFLLSMVIQLTTDLLPAEQKKGALKYAAAWTIAAGCFGLLALAIMPLLIAGNTVTPDIYKWVMAGILFCQLLLTYRCMRFYQALVNNCMAFENLITNNKNEGRT